MCCNSFLHLPLLANLFVENNMFMLSVKSAIPCTLFLLCCAACNKPATLFVSLPSSETNITFQNNLEKRDAFGILYYLYYYNGGGVAVGDINNDGLPDIYFTANSKGNNKLYLNKGNFKFEDITSQAGVAGTADWCTGVTMADVNGDGLLDIYVSAVSGFRDLKGYNQLLINNGNGHFTESAAKYGLNLAGFTTQTVFFDYDHDGDLDCFILNQSLDPVNNIVDTSYRRKFDAHAGDYLLRNDISTTGKFTDVTATAGIMQSELGYGLGVAVADVNNDGWEDIYVGNDFHENDYYYLNNGNGTFKESGAEHFGHYSRFSMGNDIADYDNDGQLDIVTADMLPGDEKVLKTYGSDENPAIYNYKIVHNGYQYQYSKNSLQHNNGNGSRFSETSLLSGVAATDWSWSPLFADFDNDGNKDLFISSGIVKRPVDLDYIRFLSNLYQRQKVDQTDQFDDTALARMPDGASHPFLYKGDGNINFSDVSNQWGTGNMKGYFNGAAYADLDNDGNLDLVINCINAPAVILKNNAPKTNYISIAFKGDSSNTNGIGAKAYVFQKNKQQYQQLMLTRGFESSSDTRLHFGLGKDSLIDSMLIVWPDQKYQVLKNVAANRQLSVVKKEAAGQFVYSQYFKPANQLLAQQANVNSNWRHKENTFNDFDVQYLIPHGQSTRGPKIAVGDVNGDGLDDFFACGAKGQPGALMVQQKNGSFIPQDTAVFNADAAFEDVDAVFFDANGDKKPDLYVASGGNEYTSGSGYLADRLYLNDGKGHFAKAPNALPAILQNKSCIAAADVDNDGDIDLFVGVLADAKAYGVPQSSYLLINNGKGVFTIAPDNVIPLQNIGMVTSARFADVNKDGLGDLVVAGEWMPVTVFINRKGTFEKTVVPNSTGLWQTIYVDDVNNDGQPDILAGNWGYNNKFRNDNSGPIRLYVHDYDLNGRMDQLMSYTRAGVEYPFLAKDEVERQLPLLKKHYLLYTEYAGVPMKEVFYGWIDTIQPLVAERLGSAVLFGDGKGGFTINDLPVNIQLAPIMSFQYLNTGTAGARQYLSGGNFFNTTPYEGRYDAQPAALFGVGVNRQLSVTPQQNLSAISGEVRDIKWLRTAGNDSILLIARNNDSLLFFKRTAGQIKR